MNGNELSWKVSITNPMPLTLTFSGTVDGNTLNGSADTGMFGSFPFEGTRALSSRRAAPSAIAAARHQTEPHETAARRT